MDDAQLELHWTALEPDARQRQRIQRRLNAWLDASDTSLAAEWLSLFRLAPLSTLGLAMASAVLIAAAPLVWLARTLL
jgi:hypothetical protein